MDSRRDYNKNKKKVIYIIKYTQLVHFNETSYEIIFYIHINIFNSVHLSPVSPPYYNLEQARGKVYTYAGIKNTLTWGYNSDTIHIPTKIHQQIVFFLSRLRLYVEFQFAFRLHLQIHKFLLCQYSEQVYLVFLLYLLTTF